VSTCQRPIDGCDETSLLLIEDRLAGTPIAASRRFTEVVFPLDATPERLREKWAAREPGKSVFDTCRPGHVVLGT
jgi:hypothetical protein